MEHHGYNASTLPFVQWVHFSTNEQVLSYAFETAHRSTLHLHILCMLVATLFLCPAALLVRRKKWALGGWLSTSLLTLAGLGFAVLHRQQTQDLYEHALHRKFSLLVLAGIFGNTLNSIWQSMRRRREQNSETSSNRQVFQVLPTHDNQEEAGQEDVDSARSSETLYRQRNSTPDDNDLHEEKQHGNSLRSSLQSRAIKLMASCNTTAVLFVIYVQILLGIATYCNLFTNHEIFNGLAHWIKASVFLLFGVWVLMRYLGFGASVGHAWNESRVRGAVTPETIECALIFTYGTIDLFIERLGHANEAVSHTDIQHMSIAMMFASAGFIGLLLQSRTVQRLLRRAQDTHPHQHHDDDNDVEERCEAHEESGRAANVMPALVVFFTGLLMSQHSQDTQFATSLHKTWGIYFCIAALLRIITYLLMYTTRLARRQAGRPPTEPLVAFCLIAGALVFMLSARDVAQGLEYYAIDLMFVISLSVVGALSIMVWTLYCMILRAI